MKRIWAMSVLVACWAAGASRTTLATMAIPAQRELTPSERAQISLSDADRVGIGKLIAVRDTLTPNGSWTLHAVLKPERWLRGPAATSTFEALISQWECPPADSTLLAQKKGPVPVLFLIRDSAYGPILASPHDGIGPSLVDLRGVDVDALWKRLAAELAATEPDSVLARAGSVVVAQMHDVAHRTIDGQSQIVARMLVTRFISGRPTGDSILVYSPLNGTLINWAPKVLCLDPSPDGVYRVRGFWRGALLIIKGRVEPSREPLEALIRRVRTLRGERR